MHKRKNSFPFIMEETGAALVEYALIIAIVGLAGAAGALTLGLAVRGTYGTVTDELALVDDGASSTTPVSQSPTSTVTATIVSASPTIPPDYDDRERDVTPTATSEMSRPTPTSTPEPDSINCNDLSFVKVAVQSDDLRIRIENNSPHPAVLTDVKLYWYANTSQAPKMYFSKICAHEKTDSASCVSFWGGSGPDRVRNYGIGGLETPNGVFSAAGGAGYRGPYTLGGDGDITYFNLDWSNNPGNRKLEDIGYSPSSFNGSTFYFEGGCRLVINETPPPPPDYTYNIVNFTTRGTRNHNQCDVSLGGQIIVNVTDSSGRGVGGVEVKVSVALDKGGDTPTFTGVTNSWGWVYMASSGAPLGTDPRRCVGNRKAIATGSGGVTKEASY